MSTPEVTKGYSAMEYGIELILMSSKYFNLPWYRLRGVECESLWFV